MKLGLPLMILLVVSFVFISVVLIINDFSTHYPEAGPVSIVSNLSQYNFYGRVNSSMGNVQTKLDNLGQEAGGWKIFAAIVAIPLAIVEVIGQLILAIPLLGSMIITIGTTLGIPQEIVSIGFIAIIVSVIIMLIKFLNKTQ